MNKKINELSTRTAVGTDLALVGDPSTGTSYKTTFEELPLVPYSGATGAVDLGAYDLTVNGLTVGRGLGAKINNTVLGSQAGAAFTTAQTNVAIGEQALKIHSTGNANTAVGRYAMLSDVDGANNTAIGTSALVFLASGVNTGNTAVGVNGLGRLTSGNYNTWLGYTSSPSGILTSGSYNTILGAQINVGVASLSNNIILADGQGNIRFRDDATSTILSRLQGTGTRIVLTDTNGALSTTPTGDTTQYVAGDGSLVAFPISGQAGTLVREVRNITGATLTKGTVVYINGASGNKPTVTKALATGDATSAQTFGIVQADITNNSNGYVVAVGDLDGLNTSAFADGDQLYLSSTVAGAYTTTKQYAPNHLVYIGVVTRSHVNQGRIEVRIQNGYEMDELHNVSAQSPANNDGLFWNSTTNLWSKNTIGGVLGYTPQAALTLTTTGTSGAATLVGATLNIPQYSGGGGSMAIGGAITSATAGSVLFAGTSGVLQQDNANLFWDDANNRLGIGTATPTHVATINTTSSSLPPVRISDFYYDYYIGYGAAVGTSKNNNYTWTYRESNETWWVSSQGGHNFKIGASNVGRFTANGLMIGNTVDDTANKLQITGSAIFYGTGATNRFSPAGRLLLNSTIDSGLYQLDVNGTARVSGDMVVNGMTVGKGFGSLSENSAVGYLALAADSGNYHAAFGYLALNANTSGTANTAIGRRSLEKNISGSYNSAIGSNSLQANLSGIGNMAMGSASLLSNTTGSYNVAVGRSSLYSNLGGGNNVAISFEAMYTNTSGQYNVAIGYTALRANNTDGNVAIGYIALNKATAAYNTATGFAASFENTSGTKNTSYGSESLKNISTSSNNTAIGANSGRYISSGTTANTTSANSTYLGSESRASADGNTNEIVIGYNAIGAGSNSVTLGNTSITKTILRGTINAANLPTSPTGLNAGDIWNNLGVLSIV